MTIYLIGSRHRYAAEQMALSLFASFAPRAELVSTLPSGDVSYVLFSRTAKACRAECRLVLDGQVSVAVSRYPYLDAPTDRVEKTALRKAIYKAYCGFSFKKNPWGSLSGVSPVRLARAFLAEPNPAAAFSAKYDLSQRLSAMVMEVARRTEAYHKAAAPSDVSLYIGVPFCPTRCSYCSFISSGKPAPSLVSGYVEALCSELSISGGLFREKGLNVKSVYMGGGTPTFLSPEQLARVLSSVRTAFPFGSEVELTVEAGRPDTIDREKLSALQEQGVTRISVNPQSLSPRTLEAIGRLHTPEAFFEAFSLARDFPFMINVDLIAGLPYEDADLFLSGLKRIIALQPENVTIHTLAAKKGATGTAPSQQMSGEDLSAALAKGYRLLNTAGYAPYYLYRQKYMQGACENTGFAKEGTACRYNIDMMNDVHTVLAFGCGGSTKVINSAASEVHRFQNPKYPKEYIDVSRNILQRKQAILALL